MSSRASVADELATQERALDRRIGYLHCRDGWAQCRGPPRSDLASCEIGPLHALRILRRAALAGAGLLKMLRCLGLADGGATAETESARHDFAKLCLIYLPVLPDCMRYYAWDLMELDG